jgi:hypothetical protein
LEYETLRSAAHAKLVELLVFHSFDPVILKDVIKTVFAPAGTVERIYKDEDGALQQLVVAAVPAQEARHWTKAQLTKFFKSIQGSECDDFCKVYTVVKGQTGELIKQDDITKQLVAERKKRRDHRKVANCKRGNEDKNKIFRGDGSPIGILGARSTSQKDKFKRRPEGRRGVGAVAKADGDEDMDMEVD